MKIRNRVAAVALTVACMTGIGVATAAPAQAVTWKGYSVSVQGERACKVKLTSAVRAQLMAGYRVDVKKPCYHSGGGFWSAFFLYGK